MILAGGKPLERPGNLYAPTILVNIPKNSPASIEELFGPVASIFRAKDIDDAIRLARKAALVWASACSNDSVEQERFIRELEAEMMFINRMAVSDPRIPF